MAKRWYERIAGGTEFRVYIDPEVYSQSEDQDRLDVITQFQALDDLARQELISLISSSSLEELDDALEKLEWSLRDRLDYYDYDTRIENITVADSAWFTPEAVESFCGESGANVIGNTIDGDNQTFWRHEVDETHEIVYRLRSYPKKITAVRFRHASGEPAREQLENLTITAARSIAGLDKPENVVASGVNPTWAAGWVEVDVSNKANVRYLKLEFVSANANNQGQIREFAVKVGTKDP